MRGGKEGEEGEEEEVDDVDGGRETRAETLK